MKKSLLKNIFLIILISLGYKALAQSVTIQVDAAAGKKSISPFIYGKNNCLSDDPTGTLSAAD